MAFYRLPASQLEAIKKGFTIYNRPLDPTAPSKWVNANCGARYVIGLKEGDSSGSAHRPLVLLGAKDAITTYLRQYPTSTVESNFRTTDNLNDAIFISIMPYKPGPVREIFTVDMNIALSRMAVGAAKVTQQYGLSGAMAAGSVFSDTRDPAQAMGAWQNTVESKPLASKGRAAAALADPRVQGVLAETTGYQVKMEIKDSWSESVKVQKADPAKVYEQASKKTREEYRKLRNARGLDGNVLKEAADTNEMFVLISFLPETPGAVKIANGAISFASLATCIEEMTGGLFLSTALLNAVEAALRRYDTAVEGKNILKRLARSTEAKSAYDHLKKVVKDMRENKTGEAATDADLRPLVAHYLGCSMAPDYDPANDPHSVRVERAQRSNNQVLNIFRGQPLPFGSRLRSCLGREVLAKCGYQFRNVSFNHSIDIG